MAEYTFRKDGLLLVHKPTGLTSFQTVQKVRRQLGVKKAGHAGTLDKFASGLLLVCIGKATKLLQFFFSKTKRYTATFSFGTQTDTDDIDGSVINEYSGEIDHSRIVTELQSFRGLIKQVPPDYSAVHVDGQRAYKIVRKTGKKPKIKEREVEIFSFDELSYNNPCLQVEIHCSTGTYIRSIARDLGINTGYFAHVKELSRTEVGDYSLENAYRLDDITPGTCEILSPYTILNTMTPLEAKPEYLAKIKNGNIPDFFWFYDFDKSAEKGYYKIHRDNELIGILEYSNKLRYTLIF